MTSLRVGFFTECYRPIVNGIVASVDTLAEGLRARGHEVYAFTPHVPGYRDEGAVYRMPSLPLPDTPYRLTLPLVSRRNLNSIIRRLDVIHAHSPFVTGWMGVRYARRFGIPLVYTYHTQLEKYVHYVPFDADATRRAASHLTRLYANAADAVIVPTEAMRDHLLSVGVIARIAVIPSGIDVRHFASGVRSDALRASLGISHDEVMALCVSRLAREKNIELLLEALMHAPHVHLVLAGDGPAREWLELEAQRLGVDARTHFLGEQTRAELPGLYASCDVFAFASLSETQGLVLAEALAAGCRIVAVDTPAARDVLSGAGVVVEQNARALAHALASIPTEPLEWSQRAALQHHAERFGADLQTDRTLALYEELARQTLQAH